MFEWNQRAARSAKPIRTQFDGAKPIVRASKRTRTLAATTLSVEPGSVRAPRLIGSPRGGSGRRREAPLEGACFDRLLQFLEGAHLDLADALAGDAELLREILEGGRVVLEPALDEDVPLAIRQELHRLAEEVAANAELLALAEPGLLVVALVDEPVLPLALAVAIGAHRGVQRMIRPH